MLFKKFIKVSALLAGFALVSACGGSGTSSSTDTGSDTGGSSESVSPAEQADQAMSSVLNSVTTASTYALSFSSSVPTLRYDTLGSYDCTSGGTITISSDSETSLTIGYEDCVFEYGTVSYSENGTLTISIDGSDVSISGDLTVTTTDSSTDITTSYTQSGTMTYSASEDGLSGTVTFDDYGTTFNDGSTENSVVFNGSMTITIDSSTYEVTINSTGLVITVDGTDISCEFNDFNATTATDDEWNSACAF